MHKSLRIRIQMPPRTLASRRAVGRFILHALVGAAGTAGQFVVLFATVALGQLDPVRASMLAAVAGAIINFVLNALCTPRGDKPSPFAWRTVARFAATTALVAALNGAAMALLVNGFGIEYLLAQGMVTAVVLCVGYRIKRMEASGTNVVRLTQHSGAEQR